MKLQARKCGSYLREGRKLCSIRSGSACNFDLARKKTLSLHLEYVQVLGGCHVLI